ncbi:MAG: FtsX-like permease family protein [Pseudomonadota bacterium]
MNWLRFAAANLALSPISAGVNILLMALGTASVVLLILAGVQLSSTLSRDARGVDLVIGAQGSPVQLILSSVYHADIPPGNIRLSDATPWMNDPRVSIAAPVALGDSFRGFRIVGSTPAYLDLVAAQVQEGAIWNRPMQAVIGASVARATGLGLGDYFAGAHGFADGGHAHEAAPYQVVGILEFAGSVVDRLVLTSVESVWALHGGDTHGDHEEHEEHQDHEEHQERAAFAVDVHEAETHADDEHEPGDHEDEETEHREHQPREGMPHEPEERGHEAHAGAGPVHDAFHDAEHAGAGHDDEGADHASSEHEHHEHLTEAGDEPRHAGREPAGAEITALLLRYETPLAAMSLPREINSAGALQAAAPATEIARILQLVGFGLDGLRAFAWVLVITACLSVFAALYGSLRSRRGDLAMLRCLGATRGEVFLAILCEGMLLSGVGVVMGYLIGHGSLAAVGEWLEAARGIRLADVSWVSAETQLLAMLLGVSALSAAIPAFQAYRTDVASTLAEGGRTA